MDAVNRMPVVAASFPLKNKEGNIIGAICSRSNINTLQKVLKKESINSTSVIIDENGNLVVHPDINDNISELNSKIQILSLKDFSDKSFYTAFKKRKKNKKNEFIFDYKNVPHIVYFFDFGDDLFKKWSFLSIAPIKFFVGDIQESRIKIIFIMIFVIFLSFIYIIYLVKRISGPILNLVKLTNHIRNFDLILDEINFSNLIEVKKLQQSIVAMRDSFLIFLKFVPKNLAHIFIEEEIEVKVGGELKKITVLFSGIEDFTIIVKNSEPYQLMNHLSEYFDNLTRIIIDSKGNIDKYNGDSIMAFWGAPLADENATLHACEAALYCQKKLSDLNRKWAFEKKPIFTTRFGIHAGDVIVGNLGSTERMNYTVIGDDVNIASRLERTNKFYGTNILITQHVYDLLKEYVIARQLDIIALKGKNTAIEVYELIALKGADPLLLPTGTEVDLCDKFQQAFDSYLNQEWDLACKILQEIKIRHPYDKPTDILLGRCLNYKKLSPGKAWDPISYLSVK
jgi:adenylate cyclase